MSDDLDVSRWKMAVAAMVDLTACAVVFGIVYVVRMMSLLNRPLARLTHD